MAEDKEAGAALDRVRAAVQEIEERAEKHRREGKDFRTQEKGDVLAEAANLVRTAIGDDENAKRVDEFIRKWEALVPHLRDSDARGMFRADISALVKAAKEE